MAVVAAVAVLAMQAQVQALVGFLCLVGMAVMAPVMQLLEQMGQDLAVAAVALRQQTLVLVEVVVFNSHIGKRRI